MANRSIRRANNADAGNTFTISSPTGSDERSKSEQLERVENTDSIVDGDGDDTESNSVSDSGSIGTVTIDPEQLDEFIANGGSGDSADSGTRKRRGRKPGSKNRTNSKKAEITLEPLLMMAHTWASVLLKTPELALEQNEAKQLSDAYSVFCEHHEVPVISPKRMSEINMVAAICMVYGPRVIAARNRKREERKVKQAKNVTPFTDFNVHTATN